MASEESAEVFSFQVTKKTLWVPPFGAELGLREPASAWLRLGARLLRRAEAPWR